MWLSKDVAGFDIPARKVTIYGAPTNLSCWTPLHSIATVATNMLRSPDTILIHPIFVSGVGNLTQNTILEALEAETGEKFEVEHVDVRKIKAEAMALLDRQQIGSRTPNR